MANIKVQISNILSESKTLRNSKYKIKLRKKKKTLMPENRKHPKRCFYHFRCSWDPLTPKYAFFKDPWTPNKEHSGIPTDVYILQLQF